MKNLIQFTIALFLLVQTTGYSQVKNTEAISKKPDTSSENQNAKAKIDTEKFKNFIGKYLLVEADFELEIIQENDKMFIISPFFKDILIQKNETTLHEPTRGVDLESIKDDKNALKFSQNGYITTIKRVASKTQKQ